MTVKIKTDIWVYYNPASGQTQAFALDMEGFLPECAFVDKIHYEKELDQESMALKAAKSLQAQADKIMADAHVAATALREAAQSLLALPAA